MRPIVDLPHTQACRAVRATYAMHVTRNTWYIFVHIFNDMDTLCCNTGVPSPSQDRDSAKFLVLDLQGIPSPLPERTTPSDSIGYAHLNIRRCAIFHFISLSLIHGGVSQNMFAAEQIRSVASQVTSPALRDISLHAMFDRNKHSIWLFDVCV